MGVRTNLLVLVPLAALAAAVLGFGLYNTVCKNSNVPISC